MKIGELASKAGCNTPTIRYYESIGLMPQPPRNSGRRVYSSDHLERLLLIRECRAAGLSTNDIALLVSRDEAPGLRWQKLAISKLPELDETIKKAASLKRLIETGQGCKCKKVADCVHSEGQQC